MNAKDIAFQCFNVLLLFTCLAVITISLSNESFELSSFVYIVYGGVCFGIFTGRETEVVRKSFLLGELLSDLGHIKFFPIKQGIYFIDNGYKQVLLIFTLTVINEVLCHLTLLLYCYFASSFIQLNKHVKCPFDLYLPSLHLTKVNPDTRDAAILLQDRGRQERV